MIGIVAVLIALLIPSFQRHAVQAQQTFCLNNLRGMQIAQIQYANDNRDFLIQAVAWQYADGRRQFVVQHAEPRSPEQAGCPLPERHQPGVAGIVLEQSIESSPDQLRDQ